MFIERENGYILRVGYCEDQVVLVIVWTCVGMKCGGDISKCFLFLRPHELPLIHLQIEDDTLPILFYLQALLISVGD